MENFSTIFQVSENDWKCFGVIPLSNEAVSCSVFPFYKVAFCGDRKFNVKRPGGKTSSNDKCKQTSSFISWSLSSRPRASSLALRCCVSEEDWTLFISAVSCLLLESSSLSERLSTSAAWRRWVKPRIWLWSALIVRYRKTKEKIFETVAWYGANIVSGGDWLATRCLCYRLRLGSLDLAVHSVEYQFPSFSSNLTKETSHLFTIHSDIEWTVACSLLAPKISSFRMDLQACHHKCCDLIGHATRYLFRDKQWVQWVA